MSSRSYNKSGFDTEIPSFNEYLETFDTLYSQIQSKMLSFEK